MSFYKTCIPLILAWLISFPLYAFDTSADQASLLSGVMNIESGDRVPSSILTHSEAAFPLVVDEDNKTFIAAALVGEGRVLHLGHETHLSNALSGSGDTDQLIRNTLSWMSNGVIDPIIVIHPDLYILKAFIADEGYQAVSGTQDDLEGADIYAAMTYDDLDEDDYETLQTFVAEGGGLITAGLAWHWAYSNTNVATKYPGNRMLWGSGLTITEDYTNPYSDVVNETAPSHLYHHGHALDAILDHLKGESPLSSQDLLTAVDTSTYAIKRLPPFSFPKYYASAQDIVDLVNPVIPTRENPLVVAEMPIEQVIVNIDYRFATDLPAQELSAHPASVSFPGEVTGGRSTFGVDVLASYNGRDSNYSYSDAGLDVWRSTGLYVPPGEVVTVHLSQDLVDKNISLLVGSHSDTLWHLKQIHRHPSITRSWEVSDTRLEIGSVFGGLLYVRIPAGVEVGWTHLEIEGAVAAPRYVHGETTLADWQVTERLREAPWAEIGSEKFIMTVPSESIRDLEDPSLLMNFWDQVLDANAWLEGSDPNTRTRPERFVLDTQISAGYMHSGYPLMGPIDASDFFVNLDTLQAQGSWGAFHELGHNHQYLPWILPGSTEAGCNIFTAYISEQIVGLDLGMSHDHLSDENRQERLNNYLTNGTDFWNEWNIWVALETYLQLKEAFGWEIYPRIFSEYRAMGSAKPTTDQARIDTWVLVTSDIIGLDLTDFYLAWGFPLSSYVPDQLAQLQDWVDHPLADTDNDGEINAIDDDDDGDGLSDTDEIALGTNPLLTDTDGDKVSDLLDIFPLDATEWADSDTDGVGDNADAFPLDATETVDTDSDGTGNNADTDDDGDGVADGSDAFPLDSAETLDTDSDGTGNNADTDDDGDGVLDGDDLYPLFAPPTLTFTYGGNTDKPLAGVTLTQTESDSTVTTLTTDANGQVTLPATTANTYTLSASLSDTGTDPVSLLDAIWILQHAGELRTLTASQLLAADASGDAAVDLLDAIYILQHLGELRTLDSSLIFLDAATGKALSETTFNPTDTPSITVIRIGDVDQDFDPS